MESVAFIPLIPPAAAVPERRAAANGPRILKFWHLASMDAPTVAVVWAGALAWTAHVLPAAGTLAALALTVWAIYLVDRLLDGRAALRGEQNGFRERHWFHWKHRRAIGILAAFAITSAACLVIPQFGHGGLRPVETVSAATLFYFGSVHWRTARLRRMRRKVSALISRKFVVAAIFSAGCVLPALTAAQHGDANFVALAAPACGLAAAAWLNLRAIGHWEGAARDGNGVSGPARWLTGFALAGAAALATAEPRGAALVAMTAASALLLMLLDRFRDRLEPVTLRAAADLALLTPVLLAGFQIR
jgi:hypothetical protein